jgi:dihydrofolate reductase
MDPDIDFKSIYAAYGAIVMGRRSYDVARGMGEPLDYGMPTYVYSRSLPEGTSRGVTVVGDAASHVEELRAGDGKDIWLWGGGELYRSLAELGLVDAISIALIPIVLGGGIPFAPSPGPRQHLRLVSQRAYPTTGTLIVDYDVV